MNKNYDCKNKIEEVFETIEKDLRVKIIDKKYITISNDNDVCNFSIKGIEEFRFCIEDTNLAPTENMDAEYRNTDFVWYAQTRNEINKFKFSRSTYTGWIKFYDDEITYFSLSDTILFMKKHKYIAYYLGALDYGDITDYVSPLKSFIFTIKSKYRAYKEELIHNYKLNKAINYIITRYNTLDDVNCLLMKYNYNKPTLSLLVNDIHIDRKGNSDIYLDLYDLVINKEFSDVVDLYYARSDNHFEKSCNRLLSDEEEELWRKI